MAGIQKVREHFPKALSAALAIIAACSLNLAIPTAQAKEWNLRMGTSKEGTIGYSSGVGLSAVITKHLKAKGISCEALPTPGSAASVRIFSKGGLDLAYSTTRSLQDAYEGTGPYEKKPLKRKPMHGWYFLTGESIIIIKADRTDMNSFSDLKGKAFFPFLPGSGVHDSYKLIFSKLGIWDKMKIRRVGLMEAADALQMGTLDAIGAYSVQFGLSTSSWIRNIDARHKIKILLPTPEEKELIGQVPGFSKGWALTKWMGEKNRAINPEKIWSWGMNTGFHPGTDIPTEVWYEIYKLLIEGAKTDLAPINGVLKAYAGIGPLKLQVQGIDAAKDIPVHPGTAKYLKEKGLWKDSWKVGRLDPGIE